MFAPVLFLTVSTKQEHLPSVTVNWASHAKFYDIFVFAMHSAQFGYVELSIVT